MNQFCGANVESYHAGKDVNQRKRIQQNFISGKTRIICATIAFGLGINKKDVRAVIHYSLPKSLENYVQEIGRAGRDGLPAFCHLFLNENDYFKLRSFAFVDSVDQVTVKKFLEALFKEENRYEDNMARLSLSEIEKTTGIRKSQMNTLLSYVAIDSSNCIKLYPSIMAF